MHARPGTVQHVTDRHRRRGLFEGIPRALYRRTGARYFDANAVAAASNGIVVAGWGLVTLLLYVDLDGADLAVFAACSVAGYLLEGAVAGLHLRRAAAPVTRWLEGDRAAGAAERAWGVAAGLPAGLLRRPELYVLGVAGPVAAAVALDAPELLAVTYLFYLCSVVLRFIALELGMRPVLEELGPHLETGSPPGFAWVTLHRRLVVTVPMVTWGAAMIVGGLLTENERDFTTIGTAALVAAAVTAAVSTWLSLVLADSISAPVVDLRDATRRLGGGDLGTRVAVVSTDEMGELAASFNAMAVGLGEREQLRAAFGAFVDPAVAERVLAEGVDLAGEEVEVSVLIADVRGFTAFAEQATAHELVGHLNELYDAIVPIVLRHGGHVNKFIGDGLLAVFGAPERHPDHAARAVAAALEIAAHAGGGRLRVGIGVNTGRVVVGTIGGGGRRDFTVIGDPVNTASRVEAATRVTGDDVLITEATLRALDGDAAGFEERPAVPLKGKTAAVRLYAPRA